MHPQIARHRAEIAEICRRYRVRRLDIFGSAARGDDFDPTHSDIDFLAEFDEQDKPRTLTDYFALRDALAAVTGHPVDLVMAGTVRNPYVRAEIERSREAIYAA